MADPRQSETIQEPPEAEATRNLRRAGAMVHIEPQVFDLLLYLIEQRDRVGAFLPLVLGHRITPFMG